MPTFFFFFFNLLPFFFFFFVLNDPAPTEIYTLPLHDALPICQPRHAARRVPRCEDRRVVGDPAAGVGCVPPGPGAAAGGDGALRRLAQVAAGPSPPAAAPEIGRAHV